MLAEAADLCHLMTDKYNSAASFGNVSHFTQTFLLELQVADGEHLINQQNFRFQMRGDGKRQAHLHAAAVMFERSVKKAFNFSEGDDLVKFAGDLSLPHSENCAAQVNILAPRKLRMESGSDFQEAPYTTFEVRRSLGGMGNTS